MKKVDVKWTLGCHYLSLIYKEVATRGHKPINLNVANAAEFVEQLGNGTDVTYVGSLRKIEKAKKSASERLTWAFLNIIWSHGRKPTADDRVDMERLAEKFLVEYRELFAELALIGAEVETKA